MRPVLGYTTLYSQRIIGLKKNIPAYLFQYEAHNISISPRRRKRDTSPLSPLPPNKTLVLSKLKGFVDNNFTVAQMILLCFD